MHRKVKEQRFLSMLKGCLFKDKVIFFWKCTLQLILGGREMGKC